MSKLPIFSCIVLILTASFAATTQAADRKWFVAVFGENYEHVVGAASEASVVTGEFISDEFVGKEMYVKIKKGYSLTQYYQAPESGTETESMMSSSSDAVSTSAASSLEEKGPAGEFGPLVDTGLQYVLDGGFYGWGCSEMYVTNLGNNIHRLRCNDPMQHN